jgi:phosphate transport system substrate-binding protein
MKTLLTALTIITLSFSASASKKDMRGKIVIDGSSTVYPITEAIAEEFRKDYPRIRVSIGVSGTGGGFKKFTSGRSDINDASRRIKDKEVALAKKSGIEYVELPIAYDGITVVINNKNTWVDHLTSAELKKLWEPKSTVKTWKDLRADWPNRPIKLYGPGTDSGTFDYFTEAINGKSHVSRSDFTKSEDDNVLVTGVSGNKDALAFFGYAYYIENKDKLKAVPIDHGKGPVAPSLESIKTGKYAPLSRPVFIYVSKKSSQRPEVFSFVSFYLTNAKLLVKDVGYIPLSNKAYSDSMQSFTAFAKGTRSARK